MLKIKLFPIGKRGQIRYRVVVMEARSKLEGKYIASLGFYNPHVHPHPLTIDKKEYSQWLNKGAQPTQTIRNLVSKL